MHPTLNRYLQKLKITSVSDLEPEEQKVYEQWQAVLSKQDLTIQDFKQFCQAQVDVIEGKWRDLNLPQVKKAELIPYHTVYKTLLGVMNGPQTAREALEVHLNQLINQ